MVLHVIKSFCIVIFFELLCTTVNLISATENLKGYTPN